MSGEKKRLHIRSLALTHVKEREGDLGLGPGQRLGLDLELEQDWE